MLMPVTVYTNLAKQDWAMLVVMVRMLTGTLRLQGIFLLHTLASMQICRLVGVCQTHQVMSLMTNLASMRAKGTLLIQRCQQRQLIQALLPRPAQHPMRELLLLAASRFHGSLHVVDR